MGSSYTLVANFSCRSIIVPHTTDAPILRSPPYEVQGYCSHINWRSSPDIPCEDISGYDVRLFNPTTGMEVIRRVDASGTFYNLLAIDKDMKNESTIFQVCL